VNPKGCHILGKLATNVLGKWCGQSKVEEGWIKLGALCEGYFALDATRIYKSSESIMDLKAHLPRKEVSTHL